MNEGEEKMNHDRITELCRRYAGPDEDADGKKDIEARLTPEFRRLGIWRAGDPAESAEQVIMAWLAANPEPGE